MSEPDNVVKLDDRRKRPVIRTVIKISAETGSRPFHCVASDGHYYWCKPRYGPNGFQEVVNEVVSSVIGQRIGAPIRPWKILDIPTDLVNTWAGDRSEQRYRLRDEPVFGSLDLHTSDFSDQMVHIDRDRNHERIPVLIALWLLCNAEDIRMLYPR